MELPPIIPPSAPSQPELARRNAALRDKAEEFEAVFLGLMLQQAGLGDARETFGGGAGEAAYSTMLAEQQARAMVASGGLGLAEPIYQAMLRAEGRDD